MVQSLQELCTFFHQLVELGTGLRKAVHAPPQIYV